MISHEGPVWQATWSHPQYGPLLASCSYDGKVLIWKESTDAAGNPTGQWQKLHEHALHTASGNHQIISFLMLID
jgi:protein transport protein SEC13